MNALRCSDDPKKREIYREVRAKQIGDVTLSLERWGATAALWGAEHKVSQYEH